MYDDYMFRMSNNTLSMLSVIVCKQYTRTTLLPLLGLLHQTPWRIGDLDLRHEIDHPFLNRKTVGDNGVYLELLGRV